MIFEGVLFDIDELVVYVERFSPGFSKSIRGATEKEIRELAQLVGLPLPVPYVAFLRRMGHEDGGLSLALEGTTKISHIIDSYRECVSDGEALAPDGYVLVGTGRISRDVCLECVGGQRLKVVFVENAKVVGLYAESFPGLLFRNAFAVFRLKVMAFSAQYVASYAQLGRRSVLGLARRLAVELGFQEQWFSDSIVFCGEMQGAAIAITQYQEQGMGVYVVAQDASELDRIGRVFKERFGLELLGG